MRHVRDTRSVFPEEEEWEEHKANFPSIITMWEDAVAEVNQIMRTDNGYLELWEPVTKPVDQLPYEIIEQILARTDFQTVIGAQKVCKKWRGVVLRSRSVYPLIYKLPIPCDEGDNPHFEELTQASLDVIIPGGEFEDGNLWELVRKVEDDYLITAHNLSEEEILDWRRIVQEWGPEYQESTHYKMTYIRGGFMGVRIPDGWPVGLSELHCDNCDKWHTDFRFRNLHPVLRFLGNVNFCFRGYGPRLTIKLTTLPNKYGPKSCFKHSSSEAKQFAKYLRKALFEMYENHLADNVFIKPSVSKLMTYGNWVIENERGLQLGEVLQFLFRLFRSGIAGWRQELHNIKANGLRRTYER